MIRGGPFAMMLFSSLKPMLPVRHLDTLDQCAMFERLGLAKELVNKCSNSTTCAILILLKCVQGLSGLIIWTARGHMTHYPSVSIMDGVCTTVITQQILVLYVGQVRQLILIH